MEDLNGSEFTMTSMDGHCPKFDPNSVLSMITLRVLLIDNTVNMILQKLQLQIMSKEFMFV